MSDETPDRLSEIEARLTMAEASEAAWLDHADDLPDDVLYLLDRVRELEAALQAASECIGPASDHNPSSDDGWYAVAVQVAAALRGDDER